MNLLYSNRLGFNLLANFLGKFTSFASVYLFVPIHINILGIQSYGIIAFYSTALAFLIFFDAGLSAAFAREAAREKSYQKLVVLLTSLERVLFGIIILLSLLLYFSSYVIGEYFVTSLIIAEKKVIIDKSLIIILALVPNLLISLYIGGLMGLQKHVLSNLLTVIFNIARSGLVIVPLYIFKDLSVFFWWQATISWMYVFVLRSILMQQLGFPYCYVGIFSMNKFIKIKSYAAGMFAISFISSLSATSDRLIVSTLRPIVEFSYYFLVGTLAQVIVLIATPIAVSILPRLTELISSEQNKRAISLYEKTSFFVAVLGSYVTLMLLYYGVEFLKIWSGLIDIPEDAVTSMYLLIIGSFFLVLQLMPYQLSLANGHNSTNLKLGLYFFVVMIPFQFVLTNIYGIIGAAIPWVILNLIAFLYLSLKLNLLFNSNRFIYWIFGCTIAPILLTFLSFSIASSLASTINLGYTSFLTPLISLIILFIIFILIRQRFRILPI
jgi:O-antigen/teichoic acid export membrane protein